MSDVAGSAPRLAAFATGPDGRCGATTARGEPCAFPSVCLEHRRCLVHDPCPDSAARAADMRRLGGERAGENARARRAIPIRTIPADQVPRLETSDDVPEAAAKVFSFSLQALADQAYLREANRALVTFKDAISKRELAALRAEVAALRRLVETKPS